eukprot:445799_1
MNESINQNFKHLYIEQYEKNNYANALQMLNDFLDITPPGTSLHEQINRKINKVTYLLAKQYIDTNDYAKAYPHLQKWYSYMGQENAAVNYYLGRTYFFWFGDYFKALGYFQKAFELQPNVEAYKSYYFVCTKEYKFKHK